MTDTTLYGISNCDTMRKARGWLERQGIDYRFHDYRKDGLDAKLLAKLADELGWENLLNRRGTTWRRLPESVRDDIDERSALAAMLDNPALIKRPVLEHRGRRHVGFSAETWTELLS